MIGVYLLIALLGVFMMTGVLKESDAVMVTSCKNHPAWSQYYVADDRDRCVFYMCAARGRRMECAPGSGVPRDYVIGIENPCTERVASCYKKPHVHPPVYPHHPVYPHRPVTKTYPAPTTTTTTPKTTTTPTPTSTATPTTAILTTTMPTPTPVNSVTNGPISDPPPCTTTRPILETFAGKHGLGARVDSTITSISDCYSLCSTQRTTCYGFDWNITARACWIHDRNTECTPLFPAEGVVHYRLTPCGVTPGMHISGGTYRPDVSNMDDCIATCSGSCKGLDFDFGERTCWHHGADTECNPLIPKEECTHIRLREVDCEARRVPGTQQTTKVAVEASTLSPSRTPAVVTSDTPSPIFPPTPRRTTPPPIQTRTPRGEEPTRRPIPKGYVRMYMGQCLTDRILFNFQDAQDNRFVPTEEDCLRACLNENSCFGIDYDRREQTCYVHSRTTLCKDLVQDDSCNHYARVACERRRADEDSSFLAIFEGRHVLRGHQLNATFTKEGCQLRCLTDEECQGVDYNHEDNTCWKHTVDDECDLPTPKPACTHYRKMSC